MSNSPNFVIEQAIKQQYYNTLYTQHNQLKIFKILTYHAS